MTTTRWEFKTFVIASSSWTGNIDMAKLESQSNECGRESWELLNATPTPLHGMLFATKRQRA